MAILLKLSRLKLQYKIALLSGVMMSLVLILTGALVLKNITDYVYSSTARRALAIGHMVAEIPAVQEAIVSEHPSASLQPIAERWRKSTGAAFIIISDMQVRRLTYPVPELVGSPMANLYREPALHGQEFVDVAKGDLAPSLRAYVPIFANDRQIGFVSVGFYIDDIATIVQRSTGQVLVAFIVALCLSLAGAIALARHVKKVIFGLEPREIATILKERMATLETIREGVIAVDLEKRIRVLNQQAARILGLEADAASGVRIDEVLPQNRLTDVIATSRAVYDEEQRVGDTSIMANSVPIVVDDKVVGAVISFRDRTELNRIAEEITGVHRFVDALRAQAHEFKNKLHTIAGLIQLKQYDEAVDFAVDSRISQQDLFSQLTGRIKDSVVFGLLLGKASQMGELGIEFAVDEASTLDQLPPNVSGGDLILIIGNLLENAIDAVSGREEKKIFVSLIQSGDDLSIRVQNSGPWIDDMLAAGMYQRGVSTKRGGRGLGLALVAEKLQLVQGTVTHHNLAQGGVEFAVSIPYRRE